MLNFKTLAIAALLLASQALATRITYSTKYTTGNIGDKGGRATKNAGTVTEEQEKEIIANIGTWSDHHITAQIQEKTGILLVISETVETKGQAATANQNAQHIVNQHI
ncbi:hypothetical protein BO94DRAFT_148283 [Aspergillus sclerotioniger CBS 115572]|uniref:Uncharacterized protein n=1 Tax=Aspergillus sclerotioniger CBS 115572 TaxID=1450535 RepID=A0A317W511_9EURO|nr:hypothetical protein BO94DRAFT_148283 [Aspergillus sclerotioniger CBS 115572]PWY81716.1 hypothetical protein BO94DRAFT_148283 [Aspergillus sclerotioniger CBS 115572]